MIHKQFKGLQWHEFELLADCPIIHACLTRHGGYSHSHLESLNLGKDVGDNPESVRLNLKKIADSFELPEIIFPGLCHGTSISSISPSTIANLHVCDGLSTKETNKGILITQADCQAAIFYDSIQHVIANVHCGWRGSTKNIYQATVRHLKQAYGSLPENLLVCISPSLGPENAEFVNYRQELPEPFWDFQVKPFYFDFWAISEWQLKQAGVLAHHIQIARIDTFSKTSDYFSYRRQRPCGRQATLCCLGSVQQ